MPSAPPRSKLVLRTPGEVENSVHPSALGVLLEAAEASKGRLRIVFTTHSPELLDYPSASGERLRVVDWRDGSSNVYRLNAETAAAVDEIETVGSMLRSNALWPEEQPETWAGDLLAFEELRVLLDADDECLRRPLDRSSARSCWRGRAL